MTKESIEATLFIGLFAILVTVFFTFALSKWVDYAIDRNVKVLNYLIEIRKTVDDDSSEAKQIDEIIEFRRAKFIIKQQQSYANAKNDSDINELKAEIKTKRKTQKKNNFEWNINFMQGLFSVLVATGGCWWLASIGSSIATSWIFN